MILHSGYSSPCKCVWSETSRDFEFVTYAGRNGDCFRFTVQSRPCGIRGEGNACLVKSIRRRILKSNNAVGRARGRHNNVELKESSHHRFRGRVSQNRALVKRAHGIDVNYFHRIKRSVLIICR
jgi:hypothetical protein